MAQVVSDTVVETLQPGIAPEGTARIVGRSPWQLFWERFRQDRAALVGLAFIGVLVLLALTAPLFSHFLAHHGPNDLNNAQVSDIGLPNGPSASYWFGADSVGRDVFIRVIYGIRTSLLVAVAATAIATTVGVVLGMAAGYFRGWFDTVISRIVDIILSLPLLLFAIGLSAACSVRVEGCLGGLIAPGMRLVIGIIALFSWTYIARIIRGQTLSLRERDFVEAARSLGASSGRIMFREILPNLVAPIIIYATLIIPANILFEAYLSFLGLGLPPSIPSWGQMISDASGIFEVAWWLMLFPGLFLLFTTLAFNLVGDGLRDALDPRLSRR
jgi:peptide/nickel transport system permease protein